MRRRRFALVSLLGGLASIFVMSIGAGVSWGDGQAVVPYGEVERFGGFDTHATFSTTGTSPTTGLSGAVGDAARLVYPTGMTVDSKDPQAPDEYAIYILENTNPQALDAASAKSSHSTSVSLEYRLQKVSDVGVVLASTTFTLTSTASEPSLHAVSLAVDGPADRVYVMIMDTPTAADNTEHYAAVEAIDAWTTGRNGAALAPAVGVTTGIADNLSKDPDTGAGQLMGPDVLQGGSTLVGDIDGASITVYGQGQAADLALAGNQYVSATETKPVVQLITTSGVQAGLKGETWTGASHTQTASANLVEQGSEALYGASANIDGSLNVTLGPKGGLGPLAEADYEPNMATVGSSALSPTTAVLPAPLVAQNRAEPEPQTSAHYNVDASLVMGFTQDIDKDGSAAFQPFGATAYAGTLAPSVVQLAGGSGFPDGLYAGLVAGPEGYKIDKQNPARTSASWKVAEGEENAGQRSIVAPASLGLRVFDTAFESLAMIGNVTPGGPCNLQSSPTVAAFNYSIEGRPSFVALAPGREGVLFALVQPDLMNATTTPTEEIAPASAVGSNVGDQIVEFAPGADNPGAGQNASKWQECPQPSGGFSITNETQHEQPSVGTGEVAVLAGAELKFDASEVKLQGGAPWAYNWDLEGGEDKTGKGPLFEFPWTVRNTFTSEPEEGKAWQWAPSSVQAEFKKPGTYTETLKLVNDFGTLTAHRALRVIEVGAITGTKIAGPAQQAKAGQSTLLKASLTLPDGDKVRNYHWDFGDGQGEDTGETAEAEHVYTEAKTYAVTLTVTDVLGKTVEASGSITIAASEEKNGEPKGTEPKGGGSKGEEIHVPVQGGGPPPVEKAGPIGKPASTGIKPLTNAQKLAKALKVCKKIKAKKRRSTCEKQAKKKYAPKAKKKGAKK